MRIHAQDSQPKLGSGDAADDLILERRPSAARRAQADGVMAKVAAAADVEVRLQLQIVNVLARPGLGVVLVVQATPVGATGGERGWTSVWYDDPRFRRGRRYQDPHHLFRSADADGKGAPGAIVSVAKSSVNLCERPTQWPKRAGSG